ncbi:MAG: hypothetical protein ACFE85_12540 [Candidatus Hodarchaeota archaeon]
MKKIYFTLRLGIIGEEDSGKEVFITYLNKNNINSTIPENDYYFLIHKMVPLKIKLYLAENFKKLSENRENIERLDILIITLNLYNVKTFIRFNLESYKDFCNSFDFKGVSILALIDTHLTKSYNRSNILRIDRYNAIKKAQEYDIIYVFEIQNDTTDIMELFDKVFNEFVFKFQLSNPELFERLTNYGKILLNQNEDVL